MTNASRLSRTSSAGPSESWATNPKQKKISLQRYNTWDKCKHYQEQPQEEEEEIKPTEDQVPQEQEFCIDPALEKSLGQHFDKAPKRNKRRGHTRSSSISFTTEMVPPEEDANPSSVPFFSDLEFSKTVAKLQDLLLTPIAE
eukprot:CAMPEP_0203749958 /NCGR_PEP_ID=MMETSP0098-20131031/4303_1 /ASSEMBLY_ACC=CAM_ASM_000208 /TAXON_ID=96639 /ORGANISM=" , Strain NY0313808BC1" /LENGTH=141 /DNA_ID=CAMNT_0050639081 /DNA_START=27 /DNA_END=452 /DNA_ORIENTATION=+